MRSSVTVVSAAPSHDLTVIETLKAELGIRLGNRTNDESLRRAIRAATSAINGVCGRPFGLETVSERFLIDRDTDTLVLTRRPVLAPITSVTEGDTPLETTDYDLFDPDRGLLMRAPISYSWGPSYCWRKGWSGGTVTVVYQGGYELLDSLPDAIERACLRLASDYFLRAGRDASIRSVDIPDVESITYGTIGTDKALPDDVRELLRPWLRVI